MAEHEKPVEKLLIHGPHVLSDAELLAIILRTGSSEQSVIELSQIILNDHPIYKGLSGLNYRYLNDLIQIPGVGKVKASQIIALTEISKRIASERNEKALSLKNVSNGFITSTSVSIYIPPSVYNAYSLTTSVTNAYFLLS